MCRQIRLGLVPGLVAATLLAWGCDRPVTPAGPKPSFSDGTELCAGGERFTGGGRIEPLGGTTTFGFNVDARDLCSSGGPIKGQLQTVWHPPHLRIQSLTFDPSSFASFEDLDGRGGECAFFGGTASVKDGNGSWRQEQFGAIACDNPDRFGIELADGNTTDLVDLTGGNIQAH